MPTLIVNPGTPSEWRMELSLGRVTLGRGGASGVLLDHPSVADQHCELAVFEDRVFARDLASASSTFINSEVVSEGMLENGHTLQVGEVLMRLEASSAVQPAARSVRRVGTVQSGKPLSFAARLADAMKYPLHGDGLILLATGTVFFLVTNFVAALTGVVGFLVAGFAMGYLCAFMQKVIVSSAAGDESLPDWPDFSDFWSDIIQPCLLFVGTILVCLGPSGLLFYWSRAGQNLEGIPAAWVVLGLGLAILPMALLGVAMSDSFSALNPVFVLRSIFAAPLDYALTCAAFFVSVAAQTGVESLTEHIQVPIVPSVLGGFLGLFFLTMQMRLLGLFYFANRQRLGWF